MYPPLPQSDSSLRRADTVIILTIIPDRECYSISNFSHILTIAAVAWMIRRDENRTLKAKASASQLAKRVDGGGAASKTGTSAIYRF